MSDKRHAALAIHTVERADPDDHDAQRARQYPPRIPTMKAAKWVAAVILVVLALGALAVVTVRGVRHAALTESTAEHAKQYVTVIRPDAGGKVQPLILPGTLRGAIEAPIYARSSGYVRRWTKDIGSNVKKGEVLAEIETPEVDQQLLQAVAARQQAAASLDLAKSSAARWESLRLKDAVSQQELDERRSTSAQAQANVGAAEANVRRLQQLGGFSRVTAPFDGVVTRRNVEVGDLIDAGSGGAARALFTIAQVDSLRIYVYVPQAYAQKIRVGDRVTVTQAELPGQVFEGTIERTAGAIDSATRTLQIEISLVNLKGKLLAGAYVQVALPISGAASALVLPTTALMFRPNGTLVAVVDDSGRVNLHVVKVGKDFGSTVEVLSGIGASDKVVSSPPDSLTEGDMVAVVEPKAEPKNEPKAEPKAEPRERRGSKQPEAASPKTDS